MSGKKIMIVDDDKDFLEELKEILVLNGYITITISDSTTVFNAAKNQKPDLILLDLKMDGLNGFQIADRLKQTTETAHIPIIGVSGIFDIVNNFEGNFFLMDFCTMFNKPVNPMKLIDKIDEILRLDKSRVNRKNNSLKNACLS